MTKRLEINFKRLLEKSEAMAAADDSGDVWRLEQYLAMLYDKYEQLEKAPSSSKPSAETLSAYAMKLSVLKGLFEARTAEAASTRVAATDQSVNTAMVKLNADSVSLASRQAHLKANTRHVSDMRAELLQGRDSLTATPSLELIGRSRPRIREESPARKDAGDLEATLATHRKHQEQIAEDMILLARQMKNAHRAIQKTIKDDKETLHASADKADKAADRLHSATDSLQKHTRKACSCWTWIMIVSVAIVFLAMVVFIRLFPK